ncbi:MAG: metallophosphatase family protein [Bacteroidales bacterium]|nr:metallophosphatase family protein [Bacteroidales bacterium]
MKIGVLSDTHGSLDKQLTEFFSVCDEIWHAGDVGNTEVLLLLEKFKPLVAVYGNIDGADIRIRTKEHQRLERGGLDIWMTHIGGYPGNYDRRVKDVLKHSPPDIFISGHSHILKVMHDKNLGLLHINPGAAGYHGLHKVRTAVRFSITDSRVCDLDVIELGPRSRGQKLI